MANVTVPVCALADHRNVVGRLTLTEAAAAEIVAALIDGDATLGYEFVREDGKPRLLAVTVVPAPAVSARVTPPNG